MTKRPGKTWPSPGAPTSVGSAWKETRRAPAPEHRRGEVDDPTYGWRHNVGRPTRRWSAIGPQIGGASLQRVLPAQLGRGHAVDRLSRTSRVRAFSETPTRRAIAEIFSSPPTRSAWASSNRASRTSSRNVVSLSASARWRERTETRSEVAACSIVAPRDPDRRSCRSSRSSARHGARLRGETLPAPRRGRLPARRARGTHPGGRGRPGSRGSRRPSAGSPPGASRPCRRG